MSASKLRRAAATPVRRHGVRFVAAFNQTVDDVSMNVRLARADLLIGSKGARGATDQNVLPGVNVPLVVPTFCPWVVTVAGSNNSFRKSPGRGWWNAVFRVTDPKTDAPDGSQKETPAP